MKKIFATCLVFCSILLTMFVSACGLTATASAIPVTPTSAPLDAIHLLKKSQTTMAHLQSVHFELTASTQPETASGGSSAALFQAFQALPSGKNTTITQGSGDMVAPDKSSIDLSITEPNSAPGHSTTQMIIQKNNVYLSNILHNWYVISKQNLQATSASDITREGMPQVGELIDLALKKGKLIDDGNATLGGKQLRHIQATFQKDDFTDLENIDIENSTWPQPVASAFTSITDKADFWIDEHTGYVYQASNTMDLATNYPPVMVQTFRFQCSKFNQPITIDIPTQATPVSNTGQIPYL